MDLWDKVCFKSSSKPFIAGKELSQQLSKLLQTVNMLKDFREKKVITLDSRKKLYPTVDQHHVSMASLRFIKQTPHSAPS